MIIHTNVEISLMPCGPQKRYFIMLLLSICCSKDLLLTIANEWHLHGTMRVSRSAAENTFQFLYYIVQIYLVNRKTHYDTHALKFTYIDRVELTPKQMEKILSMRMKMK